MPVEYLEDNLYQATCERCGFKWVFNNRVLGADRNYDTGLCRSCKATPVERLFRNGWDCRVWHGDFDLDTMQPLLNGQVFRPGIRLCGNRDCVRPSHIRERETK